MFLGYGVWIVNLKGEGAHFELGNEGWATRGHACRVLGVHGLRCTPSSIGSVGAREMGVWTGYSP